VHDEPLFTRFGDELEFSFELISGVLLALLAAAAATLATYAMRRCSGLAKQLSEELQTAHSRLEHLANRVIELERLAPALPSGPSEPGPLLPASTGKVLERKKVTPAPTRALPKPTGSVSSADLPLLRLLVDALDHHGALNAAGSHVEVDIQHIDASKASIPASADLEAKLSKLNFVAATSALKPLRGENFLSIVGMRSGADNLPRRIVRVENTALPALRALAFADA